MTMQAIFYLRVSTEQQATEGVSLEAQQAKLTAWATLNDATVLGVYSDAGLSGTKDDRPGLLAAMEAATKCKATLVVYSLSRLSRSTAATIRLADELNRAGAELVSLSEKIDTTTAAGKMVFRMLSVLNEFERDLVSERTTTALRHKKAQGQRVGEIPFGYDLAADGITLTANPAQLEAIELINSLRAEGLTYQAIADELTARGIATKKGKAKWSTASIHKIVNRAA
jgi:DNA invertase Pin-like site-specific DNA recombinase